MAAVVLSNHVLRLVGSLLVPFAIHQLKEHHRDRPIWVLPDGHMYLEASSPYYHQVQHTTNTMQSTCNV